MMNREKIVFASKSVELAEYKTYLLLRNRICYYGEPNLNGVVLPADTAEQYAQTLVDMPVYAKYLRNWKGEPSFGGHEPFIDEDGEIAFDTIPIGVHTAVEVRDDFVEMPDGTGMTLPCLFATQKIWTRNKNVVAAVKRLFEEGNLYNSWELSYDAARYLENGNKELLEYVFEGNCFLGVDNGSYPAYGPSAKVISLSETTRLVAEAVAKDIAESDETEKGGEGEEMPNKKNEIFEESEEKLQEDEQSEQEEQEEQSEETQSEEGSNEETNEAEESEEETGEDEAEEYEGEDVSEEDEDSAESESGDEGSEQSEEVVSEDAEDDASENAVESLVSKVAEMSVALNEAQKQIESLSAELERYHAAEHEAQVAELTQYVTDSGCFTADELESDEISSLISALDKATLAEMIADRMVNRVRKSKPADKHGKLSATASSYKESDKPNFRAIMTDYLYNK